MFKNHFFHDLTNNTCYLDWPIIRKILCTTLILNIGVIRASFHTSGSSFNCKERLKSFESGELIELLISLRILGDTPSALGLLGGPGSCSGNSGSEHNDDISDKVLSPFIWASYTCSGLFLPSLC